MAKNYKTNYYGKRKNGVVGIIIASTIAALLLGAAAGVMGYGTSGFKDWSFPNFSGKTKVEQVLEDDKEEKNGGAVITENETKGMRLMSAPIPRNEYETYNIAQTAVKAQIITATFTPAATSNKGVEWSVTGGDSKVTVKAVDNNPLQATVSVSGAFANQATITCTSTKNKEVKATATVDWIKNIDTSRNLTDDVGSVKTSYGVGDCIPWFSTGTVLPSSIVATQITVEINPKITNFLETKGWSMYDISFENVDLYNVTNQNFSAKDFVQNAKSEDQLNQYYSDIAEYVVTNDFDEYFYSYYTDDAADAIKVSYKGVQYYSLDTRITWKITVTSFSDIEVLPKGIEFDNNSIVFGF